MHNIYEHLNYAIALFNVRERSLKVFNYSFVLMLKLKMNFFLSLKISVLKRQFYDFFFTLL